MVKPNYASSVKSSVVNYRLTPRNVHVNIPLPSDQLDPAKFARGQYRPLATYSGNRIRTTKYTLLTFIPKNLFEQFRRAANFFFLVLVVIQSLEYFRVVDPIITALPVVIIVLLTALKDALEDYKRWTSDRTVNNRQTLVLDGPNYRNYNYPDKIKLPRVKKLRRAIKRHFTVIWDWLLALTDAMDEEEDDEAAAALKLTYHWRTTAWKNIRVGDIIRLQNDEPIPADVILLSTSEPDCVCYVETKNLDGETSLKLKQGAVETSWLDRPEDCATRLRLHIESEPPTTNMLRYQATLHLPFDVPGTNTVMSVDMPASASPLSPSGEKRPSLHKRSPIAEVVAVTSPVAFDSLAGQSGVQAVDAIATRTEDLGAMGVSHTKHLPVDVNGLLHRGAVLRNTKWAIGVIVFTGEDTKQVMNAGDTPSKRSHVEKLMNPHIAINLLFMFLLCALSAALYPIHLSYYQSVNAPFIFGVATTDLGWEGFLNFWSSLILLQNFVPISLYITVEVVKTIQAYFIYSDLRMYYESLDMPCKPKSWNLSDNLGQIEYIFSDKTGTLTRNIMEFKKCSINGVVYDGRSRNGRLGPSTDSGLLSTGVSEDAPISPLQSSKSMFSFRAAWLEGVHESLGQREVHQSTTKLSIDPSDPPKDDTKSGKQSYNAGWFDPEINEYLVNPALGNSPHGTAVRDFMTLLSVCHTVLAEEKQDAAAEEKKNDVVETGSKPETAATDAPMVTGEQKADSPKVLAYKAQSPDEACLVTLAAEMGYIFKGREQNSDGEGSTIVVDAVGTELRYRLMHIIEFDSDRKRMSVIVRTPSIVPGKQGDVILFCKGADTVIFERLLPGQTDMVTRTTNHLERFAQDGLRTLCLAYRKIPEEIYEEWSTRYRTASTKIYKDSSARMQAFESLHREVERDLVLLGSTAIEDKLQDGVPECIRSLSKAGCKIWVLTGDKIETAINVGFLCGLLKTNEMDENADQEDADMILIQVKNADSEDEMKRQLTAALAKFFSSKSGVSITQNGVVMSRKGRRQEHALIIDGQSLKFALEFDDNRALLLELGCQCKAVICCRVSPLQKAKVVEMVKIGKKVLTLAIGDGANDVSMIQAADVGVGISGEEGLQAAMTSDYAIAQFRYLQRLLLVHGRWSYSRNSYMILNFYGKNIVFTMVNFWFQLYAGFSSSVIYEFTYMILYSTLFTNLPVLFYGLFDRDGNETLLESLPQIYGSEGIGQSFYTSRIFLTYFADALWHSVVCFFVPLLAYGEEADATGRAPNMLYISTVMATSAIFVANLAPAMDTHTWVWFSHVAVWGSSLMFPFYLALYLGLPDSSPTGFLGLEFFVDAKFYLVVAIAIVASLSPRFITYYGTRIFRPTDSQIYEEMDSLMRAGKVKMDDLVASQRSLNGSGKSIQKQASLIGDGVTCTKISEEQDSQVPPVGAKLAVPTTEDYNLEVLRRRPSNMSNQSFAFSMETGDVTTPSGFSFSHTRGMGAVLQQSPLSALSGKALRSRIRSSRHRFTASESVVPTGRQRGDVRLPSVNTDPATIITLRPAPAARPRHPDGSSPTLSALASPGIDISVTTATPLATTPQANSTLPSPLSTQTENLQAATTVSSATFSTQSAPPTSGLNDEK